ncbi:MAG: energy-coupling factor transporter transmembrane protein EcfT [Selenomonadaceae bacterium]|nr:energy-coupling factor transporter transmembrane protein EcfT [Selenomonadaceae bacterium]
MLQDITLGQFFPGDSILHRLDPRVKIGLLFFLFIVIFFTRSGIGYGILITFTVTLILISRVSIRIILKSLKPLAWILIFTFAIHLVSHPGEIVCSIWIFDITREGIREGLILTTRLILLLILSSLLTFTTSPLKLTDAMERILSPLRRFGVPSHELAMMMTIAIRFIPTLIEETDKIMKAQQARGADFTTGNIFRRLKSIVPILVPLFLSAFRRADDLALAMEARGYRGGIGRTQMKSLKIERRDLWAVLIVGILSVVVIYWRI